MYVNSLSELMAERTLEGSGVLIDDCQPVQQAWVFKANLQSQVLGKLLPDHTTEAYDALFCLPPLFSWFPSVNHSFLIDHSPRFCNQKLWWGFREKAHSWLVVKDASWQHSILQGVLIQLEQCIPTSRWPVSWSVSSQHITQPPWTLQFISILSFLHHV